MSRRYDGRTTTFSPEGRLYQVEYAMEAISHAGTALGILASDGIVLACEKKITSKLLEPQKKSEKMYMIDEHVACAVAGITADANILINQARLHAQRYRFSFQEPQPVEQLVQSLCDEKQAYTQYGGLRPFGVSMLYAGWDKTYGFQLYQSDPSGNYNGWKAKDVVRCAAQCFRELASTFVQVETCTEGQDRQLPHWPLARARPSIFLSASVACDHCPCQCCVQPTVQYLVEAWPSASSPIT